MKHDLTRPCDNCPFRSDIRPYLRQARVRQILSDLFDRQASFACHKTTIDDGEERAIAPDSQQCAGAMILMEPDASTQMMRISERLGVYDRDKLDMNSPVYKSREEMIRAHRGVR